MTLPNAAKTPMTAIAMSATMIANSGMPWPQALVRLLDEYFCIRVLAEELKKTKPTGHLKKQGNFTYLFFGFFFGACFFNGKNGLLI